MINISISTNKIQKWYIRIYYRINTFNISYKNIIFSHSFDYDLTLRTKNKKRGKPYAVFLEEKCIDNTFLSLGKIKIRTEKIPFLISPV